MNGPWGRFVSHIWGAHRYLRESEFWSALIRINSHELLQIGELLEQVHERKLSWGPADSSGACKGPMRGSDWRMMRKTGQAPEDFPNSVVRRAPTAVRQDFYATHEQAQNM